MPTSDPRSYTQNPMFGGITKEMMLSLVLGRFDQSATAHRKFMRKTEGWYNLFRCNYTGEKPPFKNVVMLPLLQSACWSDAANKMAISMGSRQIIDMEPVDDASGPSAKAVAALTNQQFLNMRAYEKFLDFNMMADVYGTGIVRTGWRREQRLHKFRRELLGMQYVDEEMVTIFDGPDAEIVDILDFFPQPGKRDIESMLYVCHRYWKDLDDLEEDAFVAQQMGQEPEFDPQALAELRNMPPGGAVRNDAEERKNVWRSYGQFMETRERKWEKPVELIDMVGLVPKEYAPDGVRLRIMTVANRQVPLRNVPSPHFSLRKHFRSYSPMPDMHHFHGIGKVEPVATLAQTANKLVSNRLDVLDLVLQPAILASDSTELEVQNLVLWPGRVIKIHGETGDTNIRPLQFDLSAYPLVVNELESISRYIDQGTGIQRDTVMGMLSGDRQTAREFLGRMEQARTRLGLEARLFEIQVVEKLADDFREYTRQYGTFPYVMSMIGENAAFDPDTGEPIQMDIGVVGLRDINAKHTIVSRGASNLLSKTMQRQDFMTAMQAMQNNPFALQKTNWDAFLSRFWRAFEINPKEMILRQPNMLAPEEGGTAGTMPQGDGLEQLGGDVLAPQPQQMAQLLSAMGAGNQMNMGA